MLFKSFKVGGVNQPHVEKKNNDDQVCIIFLLQ